MVNTIAGLILPKSHVNPLKNYILYSQLFLLYLSNSLSNVFTTESWCVFGLILSNISPSHCVCVTSI